MSAFGQQDAAADAAAQQHADTPTDTGTGTTQDAAAQVNWQDRYKEAQGWGTRLAQEKAQLEQEAQLARALRSDDAAERQRALEQLGLALVTDDATSGLDDEQVFDNDPRVLQQLTELQQWREQQDAAAQQSTAAQQEQADYQAYRQVTDPQLSQMGVPDALHEVVAEAALNLPPVHTPQGAQPDLAGAWQQLVALSEHFDEVPDVRTRQMKKYAATKPRGPLTSTTGQPGTQTVQLDTRAQRNDYIAQRIAELEADEASRS
jgi:hypothetical protein